MEDFSSLAPRVATGGNCRIGEFSAINIGAVLSNGTSVGEHAVLGAGSTLLEDLASFKMAYGTPAKVVRDRQIGEPYM